MPAKTHGMMNTKTYSTWKSIKSRCKGSTNKDLNRRYSGRGITYDLRWDKFENFVADMGLRPHGMEIDRINGDGNYCKENCRWTTKSLNCANRIYKKRKLPRGVYINKYTIEAKINKNRLGSFKTVKKAEKAFLKAYQEKYGELPPEYRNKIKSYVGK